MSTTSSTTALVAHDQTLDDDPELANHMCVLTITRGDGTLFDANSLWEEDIVELCVSMGQAHPKGVLQLLETESVVAFQSSEEMLAIAHLITTATVWCNILIKLHAHHPLPPILELMWLGGVHAPLAPSL